MGNFKREQGQGVESQVNTRQDRTTIVTGGGTVTWVVSTDTLAWSATLRLRVAGFVAIDIVSSSVTLTTANRGFYAQINRATGALVTTGVSPLSNALWDADDIIWLALRDANNNIVWNNGTFFADGDSKQFGTLNSVTDRNEVTADGTALQAVGFTYVVASSQLAVYVGGILQIVGVHYTESSTTQVTFTAPYIPANGELISFVNIIGGQGPATPFGTLDEAYEGGATIQVDEGAPVVLNVETGAADPEEIIQGWENNAVVVALLKRLGQLELTELRLYDALIAETFRLTTTVGGQVILWHTADETAVEFDKTTGRFSFGTFDGTTWTRAGDAQMMWETVSGTFPSTISTTETIAWAAAKGVPKGIMFRCENTNLSRHFYAEGNLGTSSNRVISIQYDPSAEEIVIAGNSGGTNPPGVHYESGTYELVVFY